MIIAIAIVAIIITYLIRQNQITDTIKNIGESSTEFYNGTQNAKSYLNDFTYNYETGKVEYRPSTITLEMYNRIKKGMSEDTVVSILGLGNKLEPEEASTYIINWENSSPNYYFIHITFDKATKEVISLNQVGLK